MFSNLTHGSRHVKGTYNNTSVQPKRIIGPLATHPI